MSNFKWYNLKQNKCPQCEADFVKSGKTNNAGIECMCGFFIGWQRYKEITSSMVSQQIDYEVDKEIENENV